MHMTWPPLPASMPGRVPLGMPTWDTQYQISHSVLQPVTCMKSSANTMFHGPAQNASSVRWMSGEVPPQLRRNFCWRSSVSELSPDSTRYVDAIGLISRSIRAHSKQARSIARHNKRTTHSQNMPRMFVRACFGAQQVRAQRFSQRERVTSHNLSPAICAKHDTLI